MSNLTLPIFLTGLTMSIFLVQVHYLNHRFRNMEWVNVDTHRLIITVGMGVFNQCCLY